MTPRMIGHFLLVGTGGAFGAFTARGGSEPLRLLLGVGILGGFTTFSAFSLDLVTLADRGALLTAVGYAFLSVLASVAALYLGKALV
ncbi:FluC/FEX family fluoride channel [Sphingosinicella soli]|uniref:Fluoride-specific ion channel n=1 Tax=Sphingosinicella soli TaxID=333708 RepID=A0A7W7B250_9SPHN|nr:CrcB family protein [Sphingosinicella soli]MBB4632611.1 fluoride ion exporter CrcB/FEX [Sphingosinicella soli]